MTSAATTRKKAAWLACALGLLSLGAQLTAAGACGTPEARQFDFWIGEWDIVNRYWVPDRGWTVAGSATLRVYPVLDRCAIVEHWEGNLGPNTLLGFSIRAFDPQRKKWSLLLNWPPPGRPSFSVLEGEFRHGRGEFFSESTNADGNKVLTRYSFSDITPQSLRWDAASSTDDGVTWKTNWIMEMTRRDTQALPALLNGPARTHMRCPAASARQFDFLAGDWTGRSSNSEGGPPVARLQSVAILEGCAVMDRMEHADGAKEFRVRSYNPRSGNWVQYQLTNASPVFQRREGSVTDGVATLETADESGDVLTREVWTRAADGTVTWQVQGSDDGGKTWEKLQEILFARN